MKVTHRLASSGMFTADQSQKEVIPQYGGFGKHIADFGTGRSKGRGIRQATIF